MNLPVKYLFTYNGLNIFKDVYITFSDSSLKRFLHKGEFTYANGNYRTGKKVNLTKNFQWLSQRRIKNYLYSKAFLKTLRHYKLYNYLKKESSIFQEFLQNNVEKLTILSNHINKLNLTILNNELESTLKVGDYFYTVVPNQRDLRFSKWYRSKACLELNQNRILHEAVVFIDTEDLTNRLNSKDPLVVHYLKVSGDQTHLVYGFGPEHTIFGINVVDVREKPSTICFIKGAYDAELGGKVSTGNLCLFYTTLTSSGRPYRLYKKFLHKLPLQKEPFLHRLWNFCYAFHVPTEDELLFEEKDNRFFLNISRTKNGHLVLLGSHSKTSSEVWLVDAHTSSQPTEIHTHSRSKIQLLCSRNSKIKYYVEHVSSDIPENSFYLLICQKTEATDLEIVKAYHLGSDHTLGEKLFNSNSETKIEEVDVFNTYCVIYGKLKRTGDASVKVLHYDGRKVDDVELPVAYCTVAPCPSLDYTAETFKFTLSSPILPPLLLEYDTVKKVYKTLKTSEATSGLIFRLFSLDLTSCEIKSITVRHGDVLIPVTLIHSQSVIENGKNPLICYGYGAYGECLKRDFVLERIPLLADGWLLALCHVRGGGELGTHWHEQGKLMLKKNSVDDFKACIEWLQTERPYSSPQLTVIHGSSAGGLLVGAIYNKQPKMFSCAIMRAPFLDVLTEMLDPNLFLTEHERDEWGDPLTNKEVYDYIKSYSPLETLERFSQSPPNLLITTNLYDSVVPFSHSAKYIIKLRNCMEKKNYKSEAFPLILLNVIENSGHSALSLHDLVIEMLFMYKSVNLELKF